MRVAHVEVLFVGERKRETEDEEIKEDEEIFLFVFCLFVSSSLIADGANQRATTLPIPHVVTRDLPISPRFTPTSFYRDAGSALLHLVN